MPAQVNIAMQLNGSSTTRGPIGPRSYALPLAALKWTDSIEVPIPASGPPVTVPLPIPAGLQLAYFLLTNDFPVSYTINAETAPRTLGVNGIELRAGSPNGGPNVVSLTFTPNGTQAATATIELGGM